MYHFKTNMAGLKAAAAAAALGFVALGAAPASADIQLVHTQLADEYATLTDTGPNPDVTMRVYNSPVTFTAYDTSDPSKTPFSFLAFCVDVYHDMFVGDLNTSAVPVGYTYHIENLTTDSSASTTAGQAGVALDVLQLNKINALLNFATMQVAMNPFNLQSRLATVQSAIWKIENGPRWTLSDYSDPFVTANVDSYVTLAGTAAMPVGRMQTIFANDFAHQAFAMSVAVPEPASWSLMILGFGCIGAALRRRRSAVLA